MITVLTVRNGEYVGCDVDSCGGSDDNDARFSSITEICTRAI